MIGQGFGVGPVYSYSVKKVLHSKAREKIPPDTNHHLLTNMDTFGFWAFEFALKIIVQFYPNSLMFITSQVCIYMEHLGAKYNILSLKYMRGKKKFFLA